MMKRVAALAAVTACLVCCLVLLAGCGSSDSKDLQGVWEVKDTQVTVVYTDKQFKMVGETFDYTLDTGAKTINYTQGGINAGVANYSFSDDKKTLTLREDNGEGGTKTTEFVKVSDDTSAEPSADGATSDDL